MVQHSLRNGKRGRFENTLTLGEMLVAFQPPTDSYAYYVRGVALLALGRFEDALADFDQALALRAKSSLIFDWAIVHLGRGEALSVLGHIEDALVAYDEATALNPHCGVVHENKGITLAIKGDFDHALDELDTAERLAPEASGAGRKWAGAIMWHRKDAAASRQRFALVKGRVTGWTSPMTDEEFAFCTPFRAAEIEALALCGLGHPDSAERHLFHALPLRAQVDKAQSRVLYDLLSDPPLPGIDRLRAIIENEN